MAARVVPGLSKSVDISHLKTTEIGARRRRRAMAAFLTGAALFGACAAAMVTEGASARGPGLSFYSAAGAPSVESPANPRVAFADPATPQKKVKHRNHSAVVAASFSARRPVCVRLCDGFFFPVSEPAKLNDAAGDQASCDSLCPDAPTALYYQQRGSDKIEDSISASGQAYTALPVALRYRSTQDSTCACHREIAIDFDPLRDLTLRKGDALMTPGGFMVFRGEEGAMHTRRDFSALAASRLPKDQRTVLQSLERVSMTTTRAPAKSWFASAAPVVRASPPAQTAESTIRFIDPPRAATN